MMTELTFDRYLKLKKSHVKSSRISIPKKVLLSRASGTAGPTQVLLIGSDVDMSTIPKAIWNLSPPHILVVLQPILVLPHAKSRCYKFSQEITFHLAQAIGSKYWKSNGRTWCVSHNLCVVFIIRFADFFPLVPTESTPWNYFGWEHGGRWLWTTIFQWTSKISHCCRCAGKPTSYGRWYWPRRSWKWFHWTTVAV